MPDLNLLAVLVATIIAFGLGATYYTVLGDQLARASAAAAPADHPAPWTIAVELLRCLVLAVVIAALASWADIGGWTGGLVLGLTLWIGFPLVLWTGAIVHERTPWRLAGIHAGDWLVKLPVVAMIVSVWR